MVTTTPPGDGGGEERCKHRAGEEWQNPPRDCLSPLFSFSFVLLFFGDGWRGVPHYGSGTSHGFAKDHLARAGLRSPIQKPHSYHGLFGSHVAG